MSYQPCDTVHIRSRTWTLWPPRNPPQTSTIPWLLLPWTQPHAARVWRSFICALKFFCMVAVWRVLLHTIPYHTDWFISEDPLHGVRGATELIIQPCPLAAQIGCTFRLRLVRVQPQSQFSSASVSAAPYTPRSVHTSTYWVRFSSVRLAWIPYHGANNTALPRGRRQRRTFSPHTSSSVQSMACDAASQTSPCHTILSSSMYAWYAKLDLCDLRGWLRKVSPLYWWKVCEASYFLKPLFRGVGWS